MKQQFHYISSVLSRKAHRAGPVRQWRIKEIGGASETLVWLRQPSWVELPIPELPGKTFLPDLLNPPIMGSPGISAEKKRQRK